MEVKKLERFVRSTEVLITATFRFFIDIVKICVVGFLLFGAAAAIILLSKMFPEVALTLLDPMKTVALFMYEILKIVLIILFVLVVVWDISCIITILKKMESRRKKRWKDDRKKFMEEIVVKLKKGASKK